MPARNDQRDVRYSRLYKSEGTNASVIPQVSDCGSGYFLDGKSRRCVGNCHSSNENKIPLTVIAFTSLIRLLQTSTSARTDWQPAGPASVASTLMAVIDVLRLVRPVFDRVAIPPLPTGRTNPART